VSTDHDLPFVDGQGRGMSPALPLTFSYDVLRDRRVWNDASDCYLGSLST
jgi:hypothetical protein